jgi:hypothetical protein
VRADATGIAGSEYCAVCCRNNKQPACGLPKRLRWAESDEDGRAPRGGGEFGTHQCSAVISWTPRHSGGNHLLCSASAPIEPPLWISATNSWARDFLSSGSRRCAFLLLPAPLLLVRIYPFDCIMSCSKLLAVEMAQGPRNTTLRQ